MSNVNLDPDQILDWDEFISADPSRDIPAGEVVEGDEVEIEGRCVDVGLVQRSDEHSYVFIRGRDHIGGTVIGRTYQRRTVMKLLSPVYERVWVEFERRDPVTRQRTGKFMIRLRPTLRACVIARAQDLNTFRTGLREAQNYQGRLYLDIGAFNVDGMNYVQIKKARVIYD